MTIKAGDVWRGDHNHWVVFGFHLTSDDRHLIKIASLNGRITEKEIAVDRLLSDFVLEAATEKPDALVCYSGTGA